MTEGRAAGGLSGQALTKAIEETYDTISIAEAADDQALAELWKLILFRGPKPV